MLSCRSVLATGIPIIRNDGVTYMYAHLSSGCMPQIMVYGREANIPVDLVHPAQGDERSLLCAPEYVEYLQTILSTHERARERLKSAAVRLCLCQASWSLPSRGLCPLLLPSADVKQGIRTTVDWSSSELDTFLHRHGSRSPEMYTDETTHKLFIDIPCRPNGRVQYITCW